MHRPVIHNQEDGLYIRKNGLKATEVGQSVASVEGGALLINGPPRVAVHTRGQRTLAIGHEALVNADVIGSGQAVDSMSVHPGTAAYSAVWRPGPSCALNSRRFLIVFSAFETTSLCRCPETGAQYTLNLFLSD